MHFEVPQTLLFLMAVLFMGSPLFGGIIFTILTALKKGEEK